MWRAVLGLLAVSGCNQFWDLEPSVVRGSELPQIQLAREVSSTRSDGSLGAVSYFEIEDRNEIKIGPLDGDLVSVSYLPDTRDQHIGIPEDIFGQKWRLVYPVRDETLPEHEAVVLREVQWQPAERPVARIVHPFFGNLDPKQPLQPVPPGSGYQITATGQPMPMTRESVGIFTTGSWSAFRMTSTSPILNHSFSNSRSLSGPLQPPVETRGDLGIYVDYSTDYSSPSTSEFESGCRYSTGVMSFVVEDLVAGSLSPVSAPYDVSPGELVFATTSGLCIPCELGDLLGTRANPETPQRPRQRSRWEYGYLPSFSFAFSRPGGFDGDAFLLPRPRMIPFAECTFPRFANTPAIGRVPDGFVDVDDLLRRHFPQVVHYEVVDTRFTASGAALSSGYSVVSQANSNGALTSAFIDTLVAAAVHPIELRGGAGVALLSGDSDGITVTPSGDRRLQLVFALEKRQGFLAHFVDVTLYSINGSQLQRERIYTIVDREIPNGPDTVTVVIDPADLQPGTEYVFAITSYRGMPLAPQADFSFFSFPQSSVTIFTRTFKLQ